MCITVAIDGLRRLVGFDALLDPMVAVIRTSSPHAPEREQVDIVHCGTSRDSDAEREDRI